LGDSDYDGTKMSTGIVVAPGIGIFDEVQWGTHLCHLYESNQDLIEVLVAYFTKGLERNALCLWLSSVPLGQQVMEALRERIPNFDHYRQKGQIEAIPHTEWYLRDGQLSVAAAIERASGALNQAKLRGFEGIWVAGDLSWLDKGEWQTLVTYEETVCNSISDAPAVALCARSVNGLSILEALDLFRVHRAIITKRQGRWGVVESLEQAKVEKALRDTERNYKHLFDTTLDGIEVVDAATGRVLIANQALANIFGFVSPEQMVGIDPLAYVPAGDRERVAGLVAEAMFEKDLHRVMELRVLKTDGSEIWVSARGVKTEYKGRLAGLISVRDITEQRKAERALFESQRDLQAVFDGVRDGIALFDLTGRLIGVNRRVLEVGGYTEGEIVGKSFDQLDMFGAQDIAKMMSVFAPVLSGENAPPMELEVATKTGQRLVLDVRVTPLKKGLDVVGSIAVLRDITERKRAVEMLQASEQRNRLLVENANEGIMVAQNGFVKFANRKALEIFTHNGYTEQEMLSKPFIWFVHPEWY
jgi:PAS domain S-box-containing protein